MLFYSLEDESRPTGTVVNIGLRRILCKMDTRQDCGIASRRLADH